MVCTLPAFTTKVILIGEIRIVVAICYETYKHIDNNAGYVTNQIWRITTQINKFLKSCMKKGCSAPEIWIDMGFQEYIFPVSVNAVCFNGSTGGCTFFLMLYRRNTIPKRKRASSFPMVSYACCQLYDSIKSQHRRRLKSGWLLKEPHGILE